MPRRLRSNLPGAVFHLTARVQNREPLLRGLEAHVVELMQRACRRSDARLVAYAVMPNHLHLVLLQGQRPLADYMQPLLCRTALLVQRRLRREGHIFERRFRDVACHDVEYFRNAVAYVHLNPVRAGICSDVSDYPWTSHAAYCGRGAATVRLQQNAALALRMFEGHGGAESKIDAARRLSYADFLEWRRRMDAYLAAGGDATDPAAPRRPLLTGGDSNWFAEMCMHPAPATRRRPSLDLGTVAKQVLVEKGPDMTLDWLRSGERGRALVAVRRVAISRALDAGHMPRQISRYLNVSLTVVSDVAISLRALPTR
jgi:REP element-mobilizing transposase RayT